MVVSNIFYFHPYLGKWSNLTNIFQMGWNHQLVFNFCSLDLLKGFFFYRLRGPYGISMVLAQIVKLQTCFGISQGDPFLRGIEQCKGMMIFRDFHRLMPCLAWCHRVRPLFCWAYSLGFWLKNNICKSFHYRGASGRIIPISKWLGCAPHL